MDHPQYPPPVGATTGQRDVYARIARFIDSPDIAMAVSGPAGSGKTWILQRAIETILHPDRLVVCAPTHKACAVLRDGLAGDHTVTTVASLLSLRPVRKEGKEEYKPLGRSKIVYGAQLLIDEASMLPQELIDRLLAEARQKRARLIFVGDGYQLPPVNNERDAALAVPPIFDMTLDGGLVELTEIVRQAQGNPLIMVAHQYRRFLDGEDVDREAVAVPGCPDSGNPAHGVYLLSEAQLYPELAEAYLMADSLENPYYARTIAYTNKSVRKVSRYIHHKVMGVPINAPWRIGDFASVNDAVTRRDPESGDDVVVLRTDELVTVCAAARAKKHGLMGWLVQVHSQNELLDDPHVKVFVPDDWGAVKRFTDALADQAWAAPISQRSALWKAYYATKDGLVDLRPPYASTVHKTQGSTFTDTFVLVPDIVYNAGRGGDALIARLLYVALTRASDRAYVSAPLPVLRHCEQVAGGWV